MNIRKATESDKIAWIRMRKILFPDCPDERHQLETDQILSSNGTVLVAETSAFELVGFAELSIRTDHVEGTEDSPVPYLEGWFVEAAHRSQGIGKALVKAAAEFSLQAGYAELGSDTDLDNSHSIQIHKKIGFKEVGKTVHFVKSLK